LNRKPLECKSWNLNINGTLSKLILPILSLNLIPMNYLKKKNLLLHEKSVKESLKQKVETTGKKKNYYWTRNCAHGILQNTNCKGWKRRRKKSVYELYWV